MSLPPVNGVAKVIYYVSQDAKTWLNIFHVEYNGTSVLSAIEAQDLANDMNNIWNTDIAPLISNQAALFHTQAVDLATGAFADASDFTVHAGTRTGTAAPLSACSMVSWLDNAPRYRGGHPKSFLSSLVDTDFANSQVLSTTRQSDMNTHMTSFLNDVNALTSGGKTWKLVTVAYKRAHVVLTPPQVFDIVGLRVSGNIRTQRRRVEP